MFPDTKLLPPTESKELNEETFFIGDEEFPKWTLFGDEWIELDESMFRSGLCFECKKLGYCKRENNDYAE